MLSTQVAPHILWGMTEADYLAEPGLAGEVYGEIVRALLAEQAKEVKRGSKR